MSIFRRKKTILGTKKPVLDKKKQSNILKNSARVVTGLVTGAVAGLLFAPQSGKKTRQQIKDEASKVGDEIGEKSKEFGQNTKDQFNNVKDKVKEKTGS